MHKNILFCLIIITPQVFKGLPAIVYNPKFQNMVQGLNPGHNFKYYDDRIGSLTERVADVFSDLAFDYDHKISKVSISNVKLRLARDILVLPSIGLCMIKSKAMQDYYDLLKWMNPQDLNYLKQYRRWKICYRTGYGIFFYTAMLACKDLNEFWHR